MAPSRLWWRRSNRLGGGAHAQSGKYCEEDHCESTGQESSPGKSGRQESGSREKGSGEEGGAREGGRQESGSCEEGSGEDSGNQSHRKECEGCSCKKCSHESSCKSCDKKFRESRYRKGNCENYACKDRYGEVLTNDVIVAFASFRKDIERCRAESNEGSCESDFPVHCRCAGTQGFCGDADNKIEPACTGKAGGTT